MELKENQFHFRNFTKEARSLLVEKSKIKFWLKGLKKKEKYFNLASGRSIYSFLAADPLMRILQSSSIDYNISLKTGFVH